MCGWIGSTAPDDTKEQSRDGFCPYCGAELLKGETILGENYQTIYCDHANSSVFTAGIKTQNEKLYRKTKQEILELIEEIDKTEIQPYLKSRITDALKMGYFP